MFNQESYNLWKQRIYEQRISGLTIPEWCEKNQFSPHAYYYWRKIIRTQKEVSPDLPITTFGEIQQSEKVPVLSSGVRLTWKDVSIQISSKHEAILAAEVIRALQSSC